MSDSCYNCSRIFYDVYLGVTLLGHSVCTSSNQNAKVVPNCFPKWFHQITLPPTMCKNSACFIHLSTFGIIRQYVFCSMKYFLIGFKYAFFQLAMRQYIVSDGLSSSEVLVQIFSYISLGFSFPYWFVGILYMF